MNNYKSPFFKVENNDLIEKSKLNPISLEKWIDLQKEKKKVYFDSALNKKKIIHYVSKYKETEKDESWCYFGKTFDEKSIYFHGIGKRRQLIVKWGHKRKAFSKIYDPEFYDLLDTESLLSPNKRYLALMFQYKESDLNAIYILDLKTGKHVPMPYTHLKGTANLLWTNDNKLLFSTMHKYADSKFKQCVYKLDVKTKKLTTVFTLHKMISIYMYQIKESNEYLFECYDVFNSTLYKKNVNSRKHAEMIKEFNQTKIESIKLVNNRFYYINSSYKTNNGNLMYFDIENFKEVVVIPETDKILNSATLSNHMFALEYFDDKLHNSVEIFDKEGNFLNAMRFMRHGEVKIYGLDDDDKTVEFSHKTIEQTLKYKYYFEKNDFKQTKKKNTLLADRINIKYASYKSFDGENIPYFHITKKGTKINENTPTVIYGYGGFMDNNIPYYETIFSVLIEMGCAIVYPCIRGGGEKGFKWGKAGSAFNKMTTIRDYVECARFLIRNKKSNPNKIVSFGISHGGFVVASALNMAPELFKGCIPIVGLLDIYNYEKNHFIADNWVKEFGDKSNQKHNRAMKKVCPLTNVDFQEKAPSILAIAGTHDSRVAPEQIYKYINKMELLNFHHNDKIILENVKNQGHFCHSNVAVKRKIITFIINELGVFK